MAILVKGALLFLSIIIFFVFCACKKNFLKQDVNNTEQNPAVSFSGEVVSNETQAIQIAENILTEDLKKNRNDFEIVETKFESQNNVWIVSFLIDEKTVGGDISISISEKTGEIISINYGE